MSRFVDGPAAGVTLGIRRAPKYLRVVIDKDTGTTDALDQLDDTPAPNEAIHVYRKIPGTSSGPAHLCYRGKDRDKSGWYESADYAHLEDVDGEQFRDTEAWRTWAESNPYP